MKGIGQLVIIAGILLLAIILIGIPGSFIPGYLGAINERSALGAEWEFLNKGRSSEAFSESNVHLESSCSDPFCNSWSRLLWKQNLLDKQFTSTAFVMTSDLSAQNSGNEFAFAETYIQIYEPSTDKFHEVSGTRLDGTELESSRASALTGFTVTRLSANEVSIAGKRISTSSGTAYLTIVIGATTGRQLREGASKARATLDISGISGVAQIDGSAGIPQILPRDEAQLAPSQASSKPVGIIDSILSWLAGFFGFIFR